MLVYTRESGGRPPQPSTTPTAAELVTKLGTSERLTLVHCETTVPRSLPAVDDDRGTRAVTGGDYLLLVS